MSEVNFDHGDFDDGSARQSRGEKAGKVSLSIYISREGSNRGGGGGAPLALPA